ncbi:MAG: hypothetical protein ACI4RU_04080, partial [Acutalibacteraceae bacterium]
KHETPAETEKETPPHTEEETENNATVNNANSQPDEDAEEQGESRQFMQWPEVVSEIRKTNMPLWGVLSDSTAYIRDDFVLVDCMYPTFSQLIRQGTNAADVKKAVMAVTGKKYRLGIFKHRENAAKQEESTDPLSNLMEKMRKADIKVDINE